MRQKKIMLQGFPYKTLFGRLAPRAQRERGRGRGEGKEPRVHAHWLAAEAETTDLHAVCKSVVETINGDKQPAPTRERELRAS